MIAEGKASDALAVLSSVKHYEAETKELKGDALVQNEKFDEARAAYKEALAATSVGAANRAFLEQKLEDLGS
jgi:predicted negative regulator of RcsB-dependent stress response